MNILKLIHAGSKNSHKAIATKLSLAENVIINIDSSNAMARVVHPSSHRHWCPDQEAQLKKAFDKTLLSNKVSVYKDLTSKGRVNLMRVVANEVGRSPTAVRIRLLSLGVIETRTQQNANILQTLVTKTKVLK